MNRYNIGIDIGSTTLKAVLVDRESRSVVLNIYQRHQAKVRECLHGCPAGHTGTIRRGGTVRLSYRIGGNGYRRTVVAALRAGGGGCHTIYKNIPSGCFHHDRHRWRGRQNGVFLRGTSFRPADERQLCRRNRGVHRPDGHSSRCFSGRVGRIGGKRNTSIPDRVPVRCVLQDRHPEPDCAQRLPGRHCRLHLPRRGSTDSHHIGARARNQRPCLALRRAVVLHPGPAESLCRIPRPAAGKPDPARQSQPDTRMGSSLDKKRTDTDRTGSDPADRWKSGTKGTVRSRPPRSHLRQQEEYEAWKKQMSSTCHRKGTVADRALQPYSSA